MENIKKYKKTLIGILIGTIGGYLYYHFIGCATGHCAITSNPVNSTLYGAMMGGLFFNLFDKDKEKPKTENNEH